MTSSIEPFLRALVECGGSDLHCKVGSPPRVRIDGRLRKLQAELEELESHPDVDAHGMRLGELAARTPAPKLLSSYSSRS